MVALGKKDSTRPIKLSAASLGIFTLLLATVVLGTVFYASALGSVGNDGHSVSFLPGGETSKINSNSNNKAESLTSEAAPAAIAHPHPQTKSVNAAAEVHGAGGQEFPSPALIASQDARVILQPSHGNHRPDKDAVFAFAEGYKLDVYVLFVESLRKTGFDGDIVLSVASPDKLAPKVEKYLKSKEGLIAYMVNWECWKKNGEKINVNKGRTTTNNGFSDCKIRGLYGNGSDGKPLEDPRPARPVATARYELYWAWSTHYQPDRRILLIDVRDSYFQRNPFEDLPVTSDISKGGVLRLYEENTFPTSAAANIGKSKYNSGWIRGAYGQDALASVKDRPVICSGSTIGDQVAIEAYLRGMVKQFDDTACKQVGCDQGLHNYMIYSGKLDGISAIRELIKYKQGQGAVNNLAALRNSPLREQGVLQQDTNFVVNWDGSVSNIAHQFDRDKELQRIMKRRVDVMIAELEI